MGAAVTAGAARRRNGFTLIELLIVIIIVAIRAAIAVPMYLTQRSKAKDAAVKEGVHTIQIGVQSYAVDHDDTYPPSGSLDALRGTYVDTWPRDPFGGGLMTYSAAASPGSYSYVAAAPSYHLTGWLSDGSFETPGAPAAPSTGFATVSGDLIALMRDYYATYGRWPRSWAPYCYTDLGLDPAEYSQPIDNVYYKPVGATLQARPADGHVMTVTDSLGQVRVLTPQLNWNLVYDSSSGDWYYHTIDPANLIDIATLRTTPG